MLPLPHKCHIGKISVHPKNWETGNRELLLEDWYVHYRFYDPAYAEHPTYSGGKKVIRNKGVNKYTTLKDRRVAIETLLEFELDRLKEGYNPIANKYFIPKPVSKHIISPASPVGMALEDVFARINFTDDNLKIDVRSVLKFVQLAIGSLGFDKIPISNFGRGHVKATLEEIGNHKNNGYTNNNFNHHKRYLSKLFNELFEYGAVDFNPVKDVRRKSVTKKLRKILTDQERKKVFNYLSKKAPDFWRYCLIFSYSGRRTTELLRLKKEDIFINNQEYYYLQKKGKGDSYEERIGAICKRALPLWIELVNSAQDNDYLFSHGLVPGQKQNKRRQISRRWKRYVKEQMGINVDFYALKHAFLDYLSDAEDLETAKNAAGHTSSKTTLIYTVNHEKREREKIKLRNDNFLDN